jgi:hypothetical protein
MGESKMIIVNSNVTPKTGKQVLTVSFNGSYVTDEDNSESITLKGFIFPTGSGMLNELITQGFVKIEEIFRKFRI